MPIDPTNISPVSPGSLIAILGVVYVHQRTGDGGDLYLTRFGLPHAELLQIENWYEKEWFESHRERLEGTSAVYRTPTRHVNGLHLDMVVKNCRVGEDVPVDTHTLLEYLSAEFNSPWEEFALVMEMRENKHGPASIAIRTQEPLAIYVPPESMQLWQSGRSRWKMNRIRARHPGIDLDILRQYKLLYGWIHGNNIVELLLQIGIARENLPQHLDALTRKAMADMEKKGYVVADMKPVHIIIDEPNVHALLNMATTAPPEQASVQQAAFLRGMIEMGDYSVIDYELLLRTPAHEEEVSSSRRHTYLDDQRDRFTATPLPSYLNAAEIMGVPYVCGHVESTGGYLWVVGRNAQLFDYFLPERWRKTHSWRLSSRNEVYYTFTKDHIHLVWKESRVGETPAADLYGESAPLAAQHGYNSPFEEFAVAHYLGANGVPTVYARAIYMIGSQKLEESTDRRRYDSHKGVTCIDGAPVLRDDRNYITLRGYFNGPDWWVAEQKGQLCTPLDLAQAVEKGRFTSAEVDGLSGAVQSSLRNIGYDGALLRANDLLVAINTDAQVLKDKHGEPEVRICNFELLRKL